MRNNLRIILAEQRKSVNDIHKATGLSKAVLTKLYYERSNNPNYLTIKKIADYLDVTIDELMAYRRGK